MTNPVSAALEKAAEAVRVSLKKDGSCLDGDACYELPCKCASDATATAIAAFLRALPMTLDRELHLPGMGDEPYPDFDAIADAVLAAAKG